MSGSFYHIDWTAERGLNDDNDDEADMRGQDDCETGVDDGEWREVTPSPDKQRRRQRYKNKAVKASSSTQASQEEAQKNQLTNNNRFAVLSDEDDNLGSTEQRTQALGEVSGRVSPSVNTHNNNTQQHNNNNNNNNNNNKAPGGGVSTSQAGDSGQEKDQHKPMRAFKGHGKPHVQQRLAKTVEAPKQRPFTAAEKGKAKVTTAEIPAPRPVQVIRLSAPRPPAQSGMASGSGTSEGQEDVDQVLLSQAKSEDEDGGHGGAGVERTAAGPKPEEVKRIAADLRLKKRQQLVSIDGYSHVGLREKTKADKARLTELGYTWCAGPPDRFFHSIGIAHDITGDEGFFGCPEGNVYKMPKRRDQCNFCVRTQGDNALEDVEMQKIARKIVGVYDGALVAISQAPGARVPTVIPEGMNVLGTTQQRMELVTTEEERIMLRDVTDAWLLASSRGGQVKEPSEEAAHFIATHPVTIDMETIMRTSTIPAGSDHLKQTVFPNQCLAAIAEQLSDFADATRMGKMGAQLVEAFFLKVITSVPQKKAHWSIKMPNGKVWVVKPGRGKGEHMLHITELRLRLWRYGCFYAFWQTLSVCDEAKVQDLEDDIDAMVSEEEVKEARERALAAVSKKVEERARAGQLSKAAAMVAEKTLPVKEITAAVVAEMKRLTMKSGEVPGEGEEGFRQYEADKAIFEANLARMETVRKGQPENERKLMQQVQAAMVKGKEGKGAGVDGLTNEVLAQLARCPDGMVGGISRYAQALSRLFLEILKGNGLLLDTGQTGPVCRVTPVARMIFCAAKLVPRTKPEDTTQCRPITMLRALRKLLCRVVVEREADNIAASLGENMIGFGVKNGAEVASQVVRLMLESWCDQDEEALVATVDADNGYGNARRAPVSELVRKRLPGMYHLNEFLNGVGDPQLLSLGYGEKHHCWYSTDGFLQGCVNTAAIYQVIGFYLAQQVHEVCGENIRALFYLDDGILGGNSTAVLQAIRTIDDRGRFLGFFIKTNKLQIATANPRARKKLKAHGEFVRYFGERLFEVVDEEIVLGFDLEDEDEYNALAAMDEVIVRQRVRMARGVKFEVRSVLELDDQQQDEAAIGNEKWGCIFPVHIKVMGVPVCASKFYDISEVQQRHRLPFLAMVKGDVPDEISPVVAAAAGIIERACTKVRALGIMYASKGSCLSAQATYDLLIRCVGLPLVRYYLRTIPSELFERNASAPDAQRLRGTLMEFDETVMTVLKQCMLFEENCYVPPSAKTRGLQRMGFPSAAAIVLPRAAAMQVRLPRKCGGLGLSAASTFMAASFVGATNDCSEAVLDIWKGKYRGPQNSVGVATRVQGGSGSGAVAAAAVSLFRVDQVEATLGRVKEESVNSFSGKMREILVGGRQGGAAASGSAGLSPTDLSTFMSRLPDVADVKKGVFSRDSVVSSTAAVLSVSLGLALSHQHISALLDEDDIVGLNRMAHLEDDYALLWLIPASQRHQRAQEFIFTDEMFAASLQQIVGLTTTDVGLCPGLDVVNGCAILSNRNLKSTDTAMLSSPVASRTRTMPAGHDIAACMYPGNKFHQRHDNIVRWVAEYIRECYGSERQVSVNSSPSLSAPIPGNPDNRVEPADFQVGSVAYDVTVTTAERRPTGGRINIANRALWWSRAERRVKKFEKLKPAEQKKKDKHASACKAAGLGFEPLAASSWGSLASGFETLVSDASKRKRARAVSNNTMSTAETEIYFQKRRLSAIFYHMQAHSILAHVPMVAWRYQQAPVAHMIRRGGVSATIRGPGNRSRLGV